MADRADFLSWARIPNGNGRPSDPWLLLEITTNTGGQSKSSLYLVRFVASGGTGVPFVGESLNGTRIIPSGDPGRLAVEWMLHHRYTDPALGRALDLMEPGKLAFYGKGGNVVSLGAVGSQLGEITHVCLCNSNDGKTSTFAVTDLECLKKAVHARSGGNKVTFAFLKGDSPEISNSEIPAREGTRQKFLQALTGSFFTTGISALVTMLSIILSTIINGNPISLVVIFTSVITFLIFTALGVFVYTRV
ncbi:MAG: hypothetical protein LBF26_01500 [Puniceicoccales bacterium]|jgi:hypothetical protein|nr:hypothetical protein [Puniceicoccales bacterium]